MAGGFDWRNVQALAQKASEVGYSTNGRGTRPPKGFEDHWDEGNTNLSAGIRMIVWRSHTPSVNGRGSGLLNINDLCPLTRNWAIQSDCRKANFNIPKLRDVTLTRNLNARALQKMADLRLRVRVGQPLQSSLKLLSFRSITAYCVKLFQR